MADLSIGTSNTALDGISVNPNSVLQKDDFLKLLITQLQYQDPTAPMDSEKILAQTSQLATLETQQNTNKQLELLTSSFKQSKNFAAVSSIGKMARLDTKVDLKQNLDGTPSPVNFDLVFKEGVKSGQIQIFDDKNALVKTIPFNEMEKGRHAFTWDGLDEVGEKAKTGKYSIYSTYDAYRTIDKVGTLVENDDGSLRPVNFELDFQEDVKAGTVKIYNRNNEVVKTIDIGNSIQGKSLFSWDGLKDNGEKAVAGDYSIRASYEGAQPIRLAADFGSYKIESVKFEDEKTFVKINGAFISFDKVQEIFAAEGA